MLPSKDSAKTECDEQHFIRDQQLVASAEASLASRLFAHEPLVTAVHALAQGSGSMQLETLKLLCKRDSAGEEIDTAIQEAFSFGLLRRIPDGQVSLTRAGRYLQRRIAGAAMSESDQKLHEVEFQIADRLRQLSHGSSR